MQWNYQAWQYIEAHTNSVYSDTMSFHSFVYMYNFSNIVYLHSCPQTLFMFLVDPYLNGLLILE